MRQDAAGVSSLCPRVVAAVLSAGCGRDRLEPPDPARPASALNEVELQYPQAGLRFQAPDDLTFDRGREPLVTSTAVGERVDRDLALPAHRAAAARRVGARRRRAHAGRRDQDPRPVLPARRVERVRVDGARGLEVLGTQQVQGRERRVRSTHVYAKGAEFVIDTYSAPQDFENADDAIFRPLVESLKIDPPPGG
jgi:hypothetical protein